MAERTLKLSLDTGRVEVEGAPRAEAPEDERNERVLAFAAELGPQLEEAEALIEPSPRDALKRLWAIQAVAEAHPGKWVKNFQKRRELNEAVERIKRMRERASAGLPDGQGDQVWNDLCYLREMMGLLFDKLRAQGEVDRMILTPLGKLEFAQVRYQRDSADDLQRVCKEVEEVLRGTAPLDAQVHAWGRDNHTALLKGEPPERIPRRMVEEPRVASAALGVGLALMTLGGIWAAGLILDARWPGPLLILGGALAVGLGVTRLRRISAQRAALPPAFADLGKRFRERLYLVCTLRVLYQVTSRYVRASEALNRAIDAQGGQSRWKRVKLEGRDLAELFTAQPLGHAKATIESWLGERVKERFRLESVTLTAKDELDAEAWDAMLMAYLLETEHGADSDAKLLDAVADLVFARRGEDVAGERTRVYGEVRKAWEDFQRGRSSGGKTQRFN